MNNTNNQNNNQNNSKSNGKAVVILLVSVFAFALLCAIFGILITLILVVVAIIAAFVIKMIKINATKYRDFYNACINAGLNNLNSEESKTKATQIAGKYLIRERGDALVTAFNQGKFEATGESDGTEKMKKSSSRIIKKLVIIGACIVGVVAAFFIVNMILVNITIGNIQGFLRGKEFKDVLSPSEVKLCDVKADKEFSFDHAKSDFVFDNDNGFEWTQYFYRGSSTYTEPIKTKHTYKIIKRYNPLFFSPSFTSYCIELENGDLLEFDYDYKDTNSKNDVKNIKGVTYTYCFDDKQYEAPEKLKSIDTSLIFNSNNNNSSSSSSSGSKGTCPACGGLGYTKSYYGESDLEAIMSGHDTYELIECPLCHGGKD